MSMFHELMMRKKEETMYATIKGTLTESPEGVFSGFSASNYLRIQNTITNIERTEIVLDCTIGSNLNNTGMSVFSSREWGIQLYKPTNSDTKYKFNLGGSVTAGTHEFSANEHIRVKILVENNYLYIYYYDFSNNDWVLDITYPPNDYTWSQKNKTRLSNIIFGDSQAHNGSRVFTGSMNLNKSYIKINSTKYKLQAVVGYTVVGSPTIVDGVVSGFSSANYLECQSTFTDVTDFEYNITFTVNNLSSDNVISISRFSGPYGGLRINTSGFIGLTALSGSYTTIYSDISAQNGEKYNANVKLSNGILSLRVKKDTDTQWNTKTFIVQEISFGISLYFGRGNSQYNAFGGSIDMNETNIKINNKLWFNGQQA